VLAHVEHGAFAVREGTVLPLARGGEEWPYLRGVSRRRTTGNVWRPEIRRGTTGNVWRPEIGRGTTGNVWRPEVVRGITGSLEVPEDLAVVAIAAAGCRRVVDRRRQHREQRENHRSRS
jgi:hypothetical protein